MFFGLVLVRLNHSTSDKKLVRVDFVISVVVTCRKRVIKNLQNTDTKMHFTSTIGMKLISNPDKNFTSVEIVAQGSGQSD